MRNAFPDRFDRRLGECTGRLFLKAVEDGVLKC